MWRLKSSLNYFLPFLHFWEKAVCFKGVSLDQRREGRGGAGKRRRKKGKGVREGKERGSQETGWKETICSNFLFKRRKNQRQSKLMH